MAISQSIYSNHPWFIPACCVPDTVACECVRLMDHADSYSITFRMLARKEFGRTIRGSFVLTRRVISRNILRPIRRRAKGRVDPTLDKR